MTAVCEQPKLRSVPVLRYGQDATAVAQEFAERIPMA
jgi:hypothetical protein